MNKTSEVTVLNWGSHGINMARLQWIHNKRHPDPEDKVYECPSFIGRLWRKEARLKQDLYRELVYNPMLEYEKSKTR